MDFQLAITYKKSKWKLQVERLLRIHVDPDRVMGTFDANSWLYFRRTNPRKFEAYLDEDFEWSGSQNKLPDQLNKPGVLPEEIQVLSSDLLCINIEGVWTECVRFEGEWVEAIDTDTTIWDHYLVGTGKVLAFNETLS